MIKSYAEDNTPLVLIKEAINIFADGEVLHEKMSKICHMMGFQGFKRWHRIQSCDDRAIRIKVEHYVIDMFGENLEPDWNYEPPTPKDLKEMLDFYLDWEIKVYKTISRINNDLVIKGYLCEAKEISTDLHCVRKEIEKIRRWKQEFEIVNYDMSYIKLKDCELHDKMKKIEE